jgi:hypothetical protein
MTVLILLRDTTPRIPAPLLDRTWAEVGLKEYYFKILLYALPDCQKWDDTHSLEHVGSLHSSAEDARYSTTLVDKRSACITRATAL